ncbi:GNAT family N-acetyltransferase [Kitasatospora nipponensis]|uniref:GNAT family N-acetyltransferase n=1 Tax=Kitasatospora nipponensis TaxID=258049 RepID=A0ABN1W002_9ACTN
MTTPPPTLDPVELAGDGLLLRPWPTVLGTRDLADLRIGLSDPEQGRWNPRALPATAPDETLLAWVARLRAGWAEGTMASWAARDPLDGRLLGHLAIREVSVEFGTGRVGYWTMPAERGCGVARRALLSATDWAFEQLGLHRVDLAHAVGHGASCRIAERGGYRWEGTLREAMPDSSGRRHDMHLHARLATDPRPPD